MVEELGAALAQFAELAARLPLEDSAMPRGQGRADSLRHHATILTIDTDWR